MSKSIKLRNQFIDYFRARGHTHVHSAPVIPFEDPTLLFINAGMNQFKDVFLEQGSRPYTRAVDYQKCIRVSGKHNDLEEVGRSPNHHTFFEMLGNWSFGDYYKKESIEWAWDLLVNVLKIDPKRLYATVYKGDNQVTPDDEARNIWLELTGIKDDRVSYHDAKDNFWEMGEVGPCGPCTEIHYDLGAKACQKRHVDGHICKVNGDCGRIVELWNLVFIQYRRDASGKLHNLPRKHVDTGAGFERLLRVIEGVDSNYETSLFTPLISELEVISGVKYSSGDVGIPHRVAVDHVRTLSIALADGVLPSNDGRGYVMRRILRRAARYGREIGLENPYLYKLVEPLIEIMGSAYPELAERKDHIIGVIKSEEESFSRTLGRGLVLFGGITDKLHKEKGAVISGDDAFKLYDTYGFPLDLTELMARERNLTIDNERFNKLMEEQRFRARGEEKFAAIDDEMTVGLKSEFEGYNNDSIKTKVASVKQNNDRLELILEKTPFYAEAGGQIADHGRIQWENGALNVENVVSVGDRIIHVGQLVEGVLPKIDAEVIAIIDQNRRLAIKYNHTSTHLLHTALRKHLSKNTSQMGSLVAPDRLRFDFNHTEKLSSDMLFNIEDTVNEAIRHNYKVSTNEMEYKEAIKSGVIALFGEKYGEEVRVVQIGSDDEPYSRELCGGTHVDSTGQIGLFRIISESAVSAGVRRIEAVTGEYALKLTQNEKRKLNQIEDLLGSHGSDPVEKLSKTLEEKHSVEKENERLLMGWAKGVAVEMLSEANEMNNLRVASRLFTDVSVDRMKMIGDQIRIADSRVVALLAAPVSKGAGQLCCVVGDSLIVEKKLKAGDLVSKAARLAGGGGGGRPHMATAGTKSPEKLSIAVDGFEEIVKKTLEVE
ncbi:alanine--tRNA ligase [bacterium]|nr:alanine--tRNA ligase [bacterium]